MPPTRELWEGAMPPTVLCWTLVARMARSHTTMARDPLAHLLP